MLISDSQLQTLAELFNRGIIKGASVLNTMLNSRIELSVPEIKVITTQKLKTALAANECERISIVSLPFRNEYNGSAKLFFPSESASKLVTAFTGENIDILELDSIRAGTLTEIGNVVLNAIVGTISNAFNLNFRYNVPTFREIYSKQQFNYLINDGDTFVIYLKTNFFVKNLEVTGELALFLEVGFLGILTNLIDTYSIDYRVEIE